MNALLMIAQTSMIQHLEWRVRDPETEGLLATNVLRSPSWEGLIMALNGRRLKVRSPWQSSRSEWDGDTP